MNRTTNSADRRPTMPAYFLGRPSRVYLERFGRASRQRPEARPAA